MANQRNMATLDERSPAFPGVARGQARRDDQRHTQNAESHASEPEPNAGFNHDAPLGPVDRPRPKRSPAQHSLLIPYSMT